MNDEEILVDLADDINSWGDFYIISSEECKDLAREFHQRLEMWGVISFVIGDNMEIDFNEYDALLAISQGGREDYILSTVKASLRKKVKAYGICSDFRSPLAMLCEEAIIVKETDDFNQGLSKIFDHVCENLADDFENDEYEVMKAGLMLPDDSKSEPPEGSILSPMMGMVIEIKVNVGDVVRQGDVICIIEAMKMENEVCSDRKGIVGEIFVKSGDAVASGDALILLNDIIELV